MQQGCAKPLKITPKEILMFQSEFYYVPLTRSAAEIAAEARIRERELVLMQAIERTERARAKSRRGLLGFLTSLIAG